MTGSSQSYQFTDCCILILTEGLMDLDYPNYNSAREPPEWRAQRANSPRTYGRPFYILKVRDRHLLHSRQNIAQASPKDRKDGPLEPSECVGTWYFLKPSLAEQLIQLDNAIEALFRKIARDRASSRDREAAAYLRQLVDHFLHGLYDVDRTGNFGQPIPLGDIENEPMLNALRNMREKEHWKRGASRPPKGRIILRPAHTNGVHSPPLQRVRYKETPEVVEAGPSRPRAERRRGTSAPYRAVARAPERQEAIVISSDSEHEEEVEGVPNMQRNPPLTKRACSHLYTVVKGT